MVNVKDTMPNKFDQNMTRILKGVAIILMVCNHLFPIAEWIYPENQFLSLQIGGKTVAALIGAFGKICVSLFAFLTGYGLYFTYTKAHAYRHTLKKLIPFFLTYWIIILFIYIPVMALAGVYSFDFIELLLNLLGYQTTYCRIAWYVRFYFELILTFPIYAYLLKKKPVVSGLLLIFASVVLKNIVNTFLPGSFVISPYLSEYLGYLPIVLCGYILAAKNVFSYVERYLKKLDCIPVYIVACLAVMLGRSLFKTIFGLNLDVLYAPIVIFSLYRIFVKLNSPKIAKGFSYLGEFSLEIWFLHAIFFIGSPIVQRVAYWPKIDIFILIWVFILLLPFAMLIHRVVRKFQEKLW